jgi:ATP synthase protein I
MSERSPQPNGPSSSSELAGMGVQFVVAILLCLFLGKWLDARLGTSPWLLILGVFVGATAATVAMYRKAFPPEGPKPPVTPKSPRP